MGWFSEPKPKVEEKPLINSKGVIAGMVATGVTHPLDVLKIRQQINSARFSTLFLASQLVRCEGWKAFYCGLTAGLLRQATYTATRLSIYDLLYTRYVREIYKHPEGSDVIMLGIGASLCGGLVVNSIEVVLVRRVAEGCQRSVVTIIFRENCKHPEGSDKIMLGIGAGLCGGLVGNPSEVVLVRRVAEGCQRSVVTIIFRENCKHPEGSDKIMLGIGAGLCGGLVGNPSEVVLVRRIAEGCQRSTCRCPGCCRCPRFYDGTLDAFRKIISADGYRGLWRGTFLTLLRSAILSTVYIGSYGEIQDFVKNQTNEKDPFILRVYTAVATSFVAAILTSPIDVVKTFYQATRTHCMSQTETLQAVVCHRGFRGLWKGFTPYFTRMAVHTIVSFMVLDRLKDI